MSYGLLLIAAHHTFFFLCYRMPYDFATSCCIVHNLLFVAACHTVFYLSQHVMQFPIYAANCTNFLFLPHTVHFTIFCSMPLAICHPAVLLAIFAAKLSIIWGKLGAINCLAIGNTSSHNGPSDKVHYQKSDSSNLH